MTTEPVPLEELLEVRQKAVDQLAEVEALISREGPVSLKFQLQSVRQEVVALLAWLESFEGAVEASGVDGYSVDVEVPQ